MPRWKLLPLVPMLLALFAAPGCAGEAQVEKLFGGAEAVGVVNEATTVEAFRLPTGSFFQESPEKYTMTSGPVAVSAATAEKLRAALLDPKTYGWDFAKGCEPDFGVRIRFTKGKETVDVFFCFGCDILAVYFNGKRTGDEDFDDARPAFVAAAKALFPKDEAIQGLE
mgnify:CR=1 FL=1